MVCVFSESWISGSQIADDMFQQIHTLQVPLGMILVSLIVIFLQVE